MTDARENIIEAIDLAICAAHCDHPHISSAALADLALTAIAEQGYVVVPRDVRQYHGRSSIQCWVFNNDIARPNPTTAEKV